MAARSGSNETSNTSDPPSKDFEQPYLDISQEPFQVLIFLLPLVIFYEVAMLSWLRIREATLTNQAHKSLLRLFDAVGIESTGWYLPGLALIVVLLIWHVLVKRPWRVDWRAIGIMWLESLALTLPLLIVAQIAMRLGAPSEQVLTMNAGDAVQSLGVPGKIAISIGAGLYEELAFRMLIFGMVHGLLHDLAKQDERLSTGVAIAVSAILFMFYHWYGAEPNSIPVGLNVFYLLAGIYFGLLFVMRGFGIVVATHALYDIITALFLHS